MFYLCHKTIERHTLHVCICNQVRLIQLNHYKNSFDPILIENLNEFSEYNQEIQLIVLFGKKNFSLIFSLLRVFVSQCTTQFSCNMTW